MITKTSIFATATQPLRRSRLSPCAFAVLAVAMGAGSAAVQATPADGQSALTAQLRDFAVNQAGKPASQAETTITASSKELITAICAVLLNPANTVSAADVAAGALLDNSGKVRADRNLIAGKIVDAAIRASDAGNANAVAAIVAAVVGINSNGNPNTTGPRELNTTGQQAAVTAALRLATSADGGKAIAEQALALVANNAGEATIAAFARGALKRVGTNTSQVQSFVNGIFSAPTPSVATANRQSFSTTLARKLVPTNLAAAGEVIGSSVEGLDDAAIQAGALAAINDRVLESATAQIAAATAAHLGGSVTPVDFATALAADQSVNTRALIAAGVIKAAPSADTSAILTAARGSGITSQPDLEKFAGKVLTGNTDGTKIANVADALKNGTNPATLTQIGIALVRTVAKSAPATAANIYGALIAPGASLSTRESLAFNLANAVKTNNTAVGSLAGAVASAESDKVAIASDFLKRFTAAATGIVQSVAQLTTDKPAFAASLIGRSPSFAELAARIAIGISIADPANADEITRRIVIANQTTEGLAARIAGAVGTAVDVEQAASIGAKLASTMTRNGAGAALKISQAPSVAKALAKAIQKKPFVPTSNRADELGELAAAIVNGVLPNTTDPNRATVLTGIGLALMKSLSTVAVPNNVNLKADRREAADIAGSIAQAISVSSVLTTFQKQALLSEPAKLSKQLSAAVGARFSQSVKDAIAAVRALVGSPTPVVPPVGPGGLPAGSPGKYEVGPVNDPETPKKNI